MWLHRTWRQNRYSFIISQNSLIILLQWSFLRPEKYCKIILHTDDIVSCIRIRHYINASSKRSNSGIIYFPQNKSHFFKDTKHVLNTLYFDLSNHTRECVAHFNLSRDQSTVFIKTGLKVGWRAPLISNQPTALPVHHYFVITSAKYSLYINKHSNFCAEK